MAFPVIAASASSRHDTAVTSHTVNLPSGISAGDLLFVLFGRDQDSTPYTHPSGWYIHSYRINGGARTIIYTRLADGSEGSTITVGTSAADESAHWSCRITGYSGVGDHFQMNVIDPVNTNAPDPPALTPSGGAADYLWLCGYHGSGNDTDADAYPTNYSYLTFTQKYADGTLSEGGMAVAARQVNAATEDPGAFSLVTNNNRNPTVFTAAISFLRQDSVLPWESQGEAVVDLGQIIRYV